jgi:hypothetical protein
MQNLDRAAGLSSVFDFILVHARSDCRLAAEGAVVPEAKEHHISPEDGHWNFGVEGDGSPKDRRSQTRRRDSSAGHGDVGAAGRHPWN